MGIKYEYSIKKTKETGNELIEPLYRWRHGAWTDCSTTCGVGRCCVSPARKFVVVDGCRGAILVTKDCPPGPFR